MTEIPRSEDISTRLHKIAALSRHKPKLSLTSLSHHIDLEFIKAAYEATRKDGASGIDGQTSREYAANLPENLQDLLTRFKSGQYKAPPVKRVYIPKGDGNKMRPIGIPTFEDKILQRAVAMVLEPIYETDFYDSSYGFRPSRSAHQMLKAGWEAQMLKGCGWVLEVDIKSFFDTLNHQELRKFLDLRVRDGVIRRTINKWLKAGIMENGNRHTGKIGTPQGGVISPLLANIYLHYVLDEWFHETVQKYLSKQAYLFRYADDFIICFQDETDARRVMKVLPKRFEKYGLELHPEKTRLVQFKKPSADDPSDDPPGSYDLLGFTHYWGKTRKGKWIIKQKTSRKRFSRGLKSIGIWIRNNHHEPLKYQYKMLCLKLKGHFEYYGVSFNMRSMDAFRFQVQVLWKKWLERRSQRGKMTWEKFNRMLTNYPIPSPKIVHKNWQSAANP